MGVKIVNELPTRTLAKREVALGASSLAILATLLLFRGGAFAYYNRVWGEDGPIYYFQQAHHGFGSALMTPYAGYLQFLPRILEYVASVFSVGEYALISATLGAILAGVVAGLVVYLLVKYTELKFVFVLIVAIYIVLNPAAYTEVSGNIVNTNWFILIVPFLACSFQLRGKFDKAVFPLLCLLVTLSSPLAIFALIPWLFRTIGSRIFSIGLSQVAILIGTAIQGYVAIGQKISQVSSTSHWFAVFHGLLLYTNRVVTVAFFGARFGAYLEIWTHGAFGIFMFLAVLWVFIRISIGKREGLRFLPASLFVSSIALFIFEASFRGILGLMNPGAAGWWNMTVLNQNGARYYVVPIDLLVIAVLTLYTQIRCDEKEHYRMLSKAFLVTMCVMTAWSIPTSFNLPTTYVANWSHEVKVFRAKCASLASDTMVNVPIEPPGWVMSVSCSQLV